MLRHLALLPVIAAAIFLLFSLGGSAQGVLIALALSVLLAAVTVGLAQLLVKVMTKMLKDELDIQDPQKRALVSYAAATPVYLCLLIVPIGLLILVKPFLPEDCSLTIAYLGGLALAGSALGWLWKKQPAQNG